MSYFYISLTAISLLPLSLLACPKFREYVKQNYRRVEGKIASWAVNKYLENNKNNPGKSDCVIKNNIATINYCYDENPFELYLPFDRNLARKQRKYKLSANIGERVEQ